MVLRDKTWFPILYMSVITLLLSTVIILFGSITRTRVVANERIAFERAVLMALPMDLRSTVSPSEIHRIYGGDIFEGDSSSAGALRYIQNDSLIAYALPLEGPGFWAPIKGIIGISADTRTVTGIAFYEQNETPGLGGEIIKPEFTRQFVGKKIKDTDVPIEIISATAPSNEHSVHAITGATQTSSRLGKFMNETIAAWREKMRGTR